MTLQSTCPLGGLRTGTLGSSASLAIAAPLGTNLFTPSAGTDASRIGWYFDRTPAAEKIASVVMGTESLRITAGGIEVLGTLTLPAQAVGKFFAGPAAGPAAAPTFRSIADTDLPVSAVTPGAYTSANITVDAYGRITAAANGSGGGGIAGTGAAGQMTYWTGAATVAGSAKLTFDPTFGSQTIASGTLTANHPGLTITQTWNDAPTTFAGLLLNITPSASALASLLMDLQVSSSSVFKVDRLGSLTITQAPISSATAPSALRIDPGGMNALTASAEWNMVWFNLSATAQFATGPLVEQSAFRVEAPTYAFVGASTITSPSTVTISGAPTAGTNATFTHNYALWVQSGPIHVGPTSLKADFGDLVEAVYSAPTKSMGMGVSTYSATYSPAFNGRRARGTSAAPTAVQTDDVMTSVTACGYGTTAFSSTGRAAVQLVAGEGWTDAAQGAYLSFLTTTIGGTSTVEAARITDAGALRLGVPSTKTGSLVFSNAGTAFNVTIQAGATTPASYTLTLPIIQGGASTILSNDGAGVLSWVSGASALVIPADRVVFGTGTGVTATTNFTWNDGTTTLKLGANGLTGGTLTFANSSNGNVINILAGATGADYSLTLPTAQGGASTFLQNNGAGVLSWAASTASLNTTYVGFGSPGAVLTGSSRLTWNNAISTLYLGDPNATTGILSFENVVNANAVTIQAGATSATYALTLPLAQGGASTVLSNDGTGVLSWVPSVASSLTATYIGFGSAGNALTGSGKLTWNNTNGTMTVAQGTITAAAKAVEITTTWNEGSTAFNAVRISAANTASLATSKVLSVEAGSAGSTTLFSVLVKGGILTTMPITNWGSTAIPAPLLNVSYTQSQANLQAGTEWNIVNVSLATTIQWATGSLATQRAMVVSAPTLTFVAASTVTNAATFAITAAPAAGTNATITNSYALWVQAGQTQLDQGTITGATSVLGLSTTWNTGGNGPTAVFLNVTDTSSDPTSNLMDLQVGGVSKFRVRKYGNLLIGQGAQAAAAPYAALTATCAAHTNMTASTEYKDIYFNMAQIKQFATGAVTTQRAMLIAAPTYAFVGGSTITTAATFAISDAPAAGTNATITNSYALWVQSGGVLLANGTAPSVSNYTATSVTGTWNFASGTYTLFSVQATDTASDPSSVIMAAGVGGFLNFQVRSHTTLIKTPAFDCTGWSVSNLRTLVVGQGSLTNVSASSELSSVLVSASTTQWSTGDFATQRFVLFSAPTAAFVGGSTITTAATVAISGAPTAGTNATITNSYALWVQAGQTLLAGGLNVTGAVSNSFTQLASSGAAMPTFMAFTGAGYTGASASVEGVLFDINLAQTYQFATGALATQRSFLIEAPTYAFVGGSTITNAATLAVSGAPVAGTNATITNSYALWVQSGATRLDQGTITAAYPSLKVTSTWNNAATVFDGVIFDVTDSASSTGSNLFSLRVNNVQRWGIYKKFETLIIRPAIDYASAGPVPAYGFSFSDGAHTNIGAGTEYNSFRVNMGVTMQWATGALATQRGFLVAAPTYAFVGASTITTAATFAVSGAPTAGTNATITNSYALWVQAGQTQLDQGTITAARNAFTVTSTWNGAGVFFTAAAISVTDTQSTYGSYLLDVTCSSTNILGVRRYGISVAQKAETARDMSNAPSLSVANGAHTNLTAGTEFTAVKLNLVNSVEWATGAKTTQRAVQVVAPTYSFVGASTITTAATFAISGAPLAGANATITNSLALWIQAGKSQFDGLLQTTASIAGAAGLNVPAGTAPSAPVDGDIWATSVAVYARVNGVTRSMTTAVVALADAATITVDPAYADAFFTFTLTSSGRTVGVPANPKNGQKLMFCLTQGGAGSYTILWDAIYQFTTDLPAPTLSTAVGKKDYVGFIYDSVSAKWNCIAFAGGATGGYA